MTLSIITVNYNNREGLQKTIESVLSQTWKEFEWIIIDGGSTDGSYELIQQYQEHFAYWCSEPDKGVYNAMNKGIAKAKGEYLNFMNSGDAYYETETLCEIFAQKRDEDVLYGDWVEVYSDRTELKSIPQDKLSSVLWKQNICHQAMFIKTELLQQDGYDESMKILSDWKKNTELALRGVLFKNIRQVVCIYDMYGMSNKVDQAVLDAEIKTIHGLYPVFLLDCLQKLYQYEDNKYVQYTVNLTVGSSFRAFLVKNILKFFTLISRPLTKNERRE